jgi:hypothetical protein
LRVFARDEAAGEPLVASDEAADSSFLRLLVCVGGFISGYFPFLVFGWLVAAD